MAEWHYVKSKARKKYFFGESPTCLVWDCYYSGLQFSAAKLCRDFEISSFQFQNIYRLSADPSLIPPRQSLPLSKSPCNLVSLQVKSYLQLSLPRLSLSALPVSVNRKAPLSIHIGPNFGIISESCISLKKSQPTFIPSTNPVDATGKHVWIWPFPPLTAPGSKPRSSAFWKNQLTGPLISTFASNSLNNVATGVLLEQKLDYRVLS